MDGRIARAETERAWLERTLEITLLSLGALAGTAARLATPEAIAALRDLADHAGIWADRLGLGGPDFARPVGNHDPLGGSAAGPLEIAVLLSRIAHGLGRRLEEPGAPIGAESRRAALCCAADLDLHARRAEAGIRRAERSGLGEPIRRAREMLPSRQEFLHPRAPAPRGAPSDRAVPIRPCPTAPRRASSAA
jgi:hypothetical protein